MGMALAPRSATVCARSSAAKLDPELVKAYAVDFCGTHTLREATLAQVENFVQQLADRAKRTAMPCSAN